MAYIAHVVSGAWCGEVGICDASVCRRTVCVQQVGFRFQPERRCNHWSQPISQGHILSPSSVEDPGQRKPVLSLPNGLSKLGKRAHNRNFNFCHGWDSNPQPVDRQSSVLPLSYHRPRIGWYSYLYLYRSCRTPTNCNKGNSMAGAVRVNENLPVISELIAPFDWKCSVYIYIYIYINISIIM